MQLARTWPGRASFLSSYTSSKGQLLSHWCAVGRYVNEETVENE
jgi:hypothetical protein